MVVGCSQLLLLAGSGEFTISGRGEAVTQTCVTSYLGLPTRQQGRRGGGEPHGAFLPYLFNF